MLLGHGVVRRGGQVERHAERCSLADLALGLDRAAHQVDDLFHDGKPQSAAAHLVDARVDRAGKRRVHLLHKFRRHADARVAHDGDEADLIASSKRLLENLELHLAAVRRIFDGVREQVHINLPEADLVGEQHTAGDIVQLARKADVLCLRHARDGLRVEVKQLRQLHRLRDDLELPALNARDVQHIVDELLQIAAADADLFQALFHLVRVVRVL